MNEEFSGDTDFEIALGTTGIFIQDNHLLKKEKDGTVTAKYPLSSIQAVSSFEKIDSTAFVSLIIGGACGYVSYQYIDNNVLKWIFYVVAVLLLLFFIGDLKKTIIRLIIQSNTVEYPCREDRAVVNGFVISLQEFLRNRKR